MFVVANIVVYMSGSVAVAQDSYFAQILYSNHFVFRGLPQGRSAESSQPAQLTELHFTSDSNFLLGIEGVGTYGGLELRFLGGFNFAYEESRLQVAFKSYKFEQQTVQSLGGDNFDEVVYMIASPQVEIHFAQGLNQAGDAYAVRYKGQLTSSVSGFVEWGTYAPADFQLRGNQDGVSQYVHTALRQYFADVFVEIGYISRTAGRDDFIQLSVGSTWKGIFNADDSR